PRPSPLSFPTRRSSDLSIDALLLTHAHLDHCGLIPLIAKRGFHGPIFATAGTVELATLVLLDSGKLQEEFAKRGARRDDRRDHGDRKSTGLNSSHLGIS